jgi:hypothetical protein
MKYTLSKTAAQVAAQVAVEAIANDPGAYADSTRLAVLQNGEEQHVAALYLDMIR